MVSANWSRRSASRRAAASRTAARCQRGSGPPASAAWAERTARSTSAGPHTGTRPISEPSYGERTAIDSVPVNRSPASGTRAHRRRMDVVIRSTILRPWCAPPRPRHPFLDWPGPIAFAHRGGASEAPENTMPAFERAVGLGYRYLETDVHTTADGVVVAFHDDDLSRTCGRPGLISELPWREVATARVDGREPIPRLADLLDAWPRRPAEHRLQDRSRSPIRSPTSCAAPACSTGCASAPSATAACCACAAGSVRRCARAPVRSSSASLRFIGVTEPRRAGGAGARAQGRHHHHQPSASSRRRHRRGIEVHVWTIDDPAEMGRLLDLGVDGIMTDRPAVLRDVLAAARSVGGVTRRRRDRGTAIAAPTERAEQDRRTDRRDRRATARCRPSATTPCRRRGRHRRRRARRRCRSRHRPAASPTTRPRRRRRRAAARAATSAAPHAADAVGGEAEPLDEGEQLVAVPAPAARAQPRQQRPADHDGCADRHHGDGGRPPPQRRAHRHPGTVRRRRMRGTAARPTAAASHRVGDR